MEVAILPTQPLPDMSQLSGRVKEIFLQQGHRFVDEQRPPTRLTIRQNSTALILDLQFETRSVQLVAKAIRPISQVGAAGNLVAVMRRLRNECDVLCQTFPRFLGHDADLNLVIREFVQGQSLLHILRKRFYVPFWQSPRCHAALTLVGEKLAALHRLSATRVGLDFPPQKNGDLFASLQTSLQDRLLARTLPESFADLNRFISFLSPEFFDRVSDKLLWIDPQPKNIILNSSGEVRFIDVDFMVGNPAFGLAQFLVSLDRLALRFPGQFCQARIDGWKTDVLRGYFQHAAPEIAQDLIFFYPYKILRILQHHASRRPMFRRYLSWLYARPLRRFLDRLDNSSPSTVQKLPVEFLLNQDLPCTVSANGHAAIKSNGALAAPLTDCNPAKERSPVSNADDQHSNDLPLTVIERRPGWQVVNFRELWRFRELLFFLTWRDIMVRYKQTLLGAAWAILQPLSTVIVFAFFLGRLGGVSDGIQNYPLFVLVAVLPWTFFANAVSTAGNSVVANERLVSKIYFPRLIIPVSSVGAALFDFLISLGILAVMMAWYGVAPGWSILLAPLVMLLLTATAAGVGTLLAALIVAHRDFRYILNFSVQLWMFATPCIYLKATALGPTSQLVLPLNPAYGLLLNFRQTVLGGPLDWYALIVSAAVGLLLLLIGCLYFRRVERSFADVI